MNFRTGLFPDLEWHLWRAWHIDTFLHHVTGQVKISSKNFAWPWKTNAHVHQWLLHWFIKGSPDNYGCMDIHNTFKGSPRGMTKEPLDERHAGGGGVGARKSHLSALKVTQPSDSPIKIPHAPESKDSKSCPLSFSENTTSICILYMHVYLYVLFAYTVIQLEVFNGCKGRCSKTCYENFLLTICRPDVWYTDAMCLPRTRTLPLNPDNIAFEINSVLHLGEEAQLV